jgi:hypothetical protein
MPLYANPFQGGFDVNNPFQMGDDFWQNYYGDNPQYGYRRALNQQGTDPFSAFGRFAKSQFGTMQDDYNAKLPELPFGTTFVDFANQGGLKDLESKFRNLPAGQRGQNLGALAPKVRYLF